MRADRLGCFVPLLVSLLPHLASAAPLFTGLGDPPGGDFRSLAKAVSGDGSVVVGRGRSASG